jgi:hypothetical protein
LVVVNDLPSPGIVLVIKMHFAFLLSSLRRRLEWRVRKASATFLGSCMGASGAGLSATYQNGGRGFKERGSIQPSAVSRQLVCRKLTTDR